MALNWFKFKEAVSIIRCCPCSSVSHVLFVINQEKNHNLLVMNQKCGCRLIAEESKIDSYSTSFGFEEQLKKKKNSRTLAPFPLVWNSNRYPRALLMSDFLTLAYNQYLLVITIQIAVSHLNHLKWEKECLV